jgi:hypothetical protein
MTRGWASGAALCAVLLALSCGGSPSQPTPPPPPPPPNNPPTIESVTAASNRVEVGDGVALTAKVTDAETPVDSLTYEWKGSVNGTFTGTGAQVTWRPAAGVTTPVEAELTVTVIERYAARVGSAVEARENKASSSTKVHVNDSLAETIALGLQFLNDFGVSANSPEYCVRNFTDSCRGKAEELSDISFDRSNYVIVRYDVHVDRVEFNGAKTVAYIYAPCTFVSQRKATGAVLPPSTGVCAMTAVYEPYRWWLCTSSFCGPGEDCNPTPKGSGSLAGALRRRVG